MKFLAGFFFGIIVAVGLLVSVAAKPKDKPSTPQDNSFWTTVEDVKEKVMKPSEPKERKKLSWWKQNRINCFHTYEDECDCK